MNASNIRKLQNEMISMEEESDRLIPFDKYYAIILEIKDFQEDTNNLAIKFLTKNVNHQPLFTYSYGNTISLLYSCTEEGKNHYLNGSHHELISEYVSILSLETGKNVKCSIVEFETRIYILTYFTWKNHNNYKKCMIDISKGKITLNDTKNKTFNELLSILKDINISWDEVSPHLRYGTLYKLRKKKGKIIISKLSEFFDVRENKRYNNFMFE